MSKVLIERESLENIARKIRQKTASTEKMTVADMPDKIGTLHGYVSNVQAISSDPKASIISVYNPDMQYISQVEQIIYPEPTGIRVWTKSTGGNDASLFIQMVAVSGGNLEPAGPARELMYAQAQSSVNCFNVISIIYGRTAYKWSVDALTELSDGTTQYNVNETVKTWSYSEQIDLLLTMT